MTKTLPLASLLAAAAAAPVLAGPAEEVRCQEIGFSKAAEARDAASFAAFIDADARFVGDSVARGVDEIVAGWSVFFAANGPRIKWRPQFVELLEDGRLALTRGPYRMQVTGEDGEVSEHWGTFNSVWRLHDDGRWRVVFDAGSPPNEKPGDEIRALLDQEDAC
jgi:uncharacterized protein (TIGR02246 family)